MDDDAFRDQVWAALEPLLTKSGDVHEYLQGAADLCPALLEVEGSYSIATMLYGHPMTVGSSDRKAWEVDQIEFDAQEGPCVEALQFGADSGPIDVTTEQRWPAWTAVASMLGFRSGGGIPGDMPTGGRVALNLYSPEADAFGHAELDRGRVFIQEVARTVPAALRLFEQSERIAQLEQALASRSTIDQAIGVLMAQNRCTRDQAFGILRRASQNRNVKLRDVAALIIERFTGHPAAPPPPFQSPRSRKDPGA
jgi:hypothetical protein